MNTDPNAPRHPGARTMSTEPEAGNDERVQAAIERVAPIIAGMTHNAAWEGQDDRDISANYADLIYSQWASWKFQGGKPGWRRVARAALAALRPGDVLPGEGSGRLVVVREVVTETPSSDVTKRYVKCIDDSGFGIFLTAGKTYEVVDETDDVFGHFYRVMDDRGRHEDYRAARFNAYTTKEPPHD